MFVVVITAMEYICCVVRFSIFTYIWWEWQDDDRTMNLFRNLILLNWMAN